MEIAALWEWLLQQQWEVVLCASALAIFVSVRIGVRFDVNTWIENRAQAKQSEERWKLIETCAHMWTLYPVSPYSRCNACPVLIATSTLSFALREMAVKPIILSVSYSMFEIPAGEPVTNDYIGKRE